MAQTAEDEYRAIVCIGHDIGRAEGAGDLDRFARTMPPSWISVYMDNHTLLHSMIAPKKVLVLTAEHLR